MSLADLKKSRQQDAEALAAEMVRINSKQSDRVEDTRFWQPQVDKAGNGNAIIRFLPRPPEENFPFVRYWEHWFKGSSGQWYAELCPTSIGKSCPVCDHNNKLWNTEIEANRKIVSSQKRVLRFVSNILIVKNPDKPDDEGKVFLYKYGKKIYEKLFEKSNPTFEGEESIDPFDPWSGCNFKLKIRNFEGRRNYDKCEFEAPSPIHKDDKVMEKIYQGVYPLQPLVDPSLFKPYEVLQDRLNTVIGSARRSGDNVVSMPNVGKETDVDEDSDDHNAEFFKSLAED